MKTFLWLSLFFCGWIHCIHGAPRSVKIVYHGIGNATNELVLGMPLSFRIQQVPSTPVKATTSPHPILQSDSTIGSPGETSENWYLKTDVKILDDAQNVVNVGKLIPIGPQSMGAWGRVF
jgi:hypothetical protein